MAEQSARLWGARFRASPSAELTALSRSESSYFRLVPYDLASSAAHARELVRANILTASEAEQVCSALQTIGEEHRSGAVIPSPADEDIHTFLERVLGERVGIVGGKLRAGRSRNDQAANDLKLYLRDVAHRIGLDILNLQSALIGQANQHVETVTTGFTHLQPAQPVSFAHQLLAHAQTFARDFERLQDWDRRAARSPLGAAALAGSAIAMHPEISAQELGYDAPSENSIDAVGSRDHVAEFLFVMAMFGVHLSRLAEELFLWSSRQFRWIEMDDAYATGSSIMPQKKNCDIAELTRGRASRLIGSLTTMLVALKGLPFAYNRDLAEDKHAAFDTIDALELVVPAMTGLIRTMRVNVDRMQQHSVEGFTLATEVADWLAKNGVPFSEAHEITGALVRYCEDRSIGLEDLSEDDLATVDARLHPSIKSALSAKAAIEARKAYGGTAPDRVKEQIGRLRDLLNKQQEWLKLYSGPRFER
ncbi:argininosuccinate lyase [Phyllobacterium ifriqiyense]|uniref:Argininosuccinate lyase n=1 Tax=Phyllobacterium ifriqiyense TaxID=314238 RepID=A0ABU0SAA1_9HYPH|nr:argininosuccinate lyase [Phyllobacterium ifriqiyense]MDQ0997694.1 argininosuccinate lyase [Phyllobacterium ifriqiyense]